MKTLGRLGAIIILGGLIAAGLATIHSPASWVAGHRASVVHADGANIVGSWIVAVEVNTPAGPQPFATELGSFSQGGIFTDAISIAHSSQNPYFAGPLAPLAVDFSDAFGTWEQATPNQVAMTFKRFIFAGANTPTADYGSFFPGENVGIATIEAVGTLQNNSGGQTLSGPFTFQLTNLQGKVVLAASGTFTATRIAVQPLVAP